MHVFLVRSREQNRCRRRCSTHALPSPPPDANDDDDALLLLRLLISLQFSSSSSGKENDCCDAFFRSRCCFGDARRRRRRRRRRPPPLRKVFSPSSLHRVVANAWGCRHASSPDAKRPRRRRLALEEDVADVGDVSSLSTIPEDARATATLLAKADGILAGERVANEVYRWWMETSKRAG